MPEYLAPGVYVEETSFRSKSIEGVGTSTTAFVGATRKGPIATTQRDGAGNLPAAPELLTSFGDFVRVFGGLEPLGFASGRPNYLANAALNFFNEGGGRLYVSRVVAANAAAATRDLTPGAAAANSAVWRARAPGAAGNATVVLRELLTPVTGVGLNAAPAGSLVRAGAAAVATAAGISGNPAVTQPFPVANGSVLRINASGTVIDVVFRGGVAEAVAATALAANSVVNAANRNLPVVINGSAQTLTLTDGSYTPDQLAVEVNRQLRGGYARIQTVANNAFLVIGSDRRGLTASVSIPAPAFGFNAGQAGAPVPADNNVDDLEAVRIDELNGLLNNNPANGQRFATATALPNGSLRLQSTATGPAATLAVVDATAANTVSAHPALGLTAGGQAAAGSAGTGLATFEKQANGTWSDGNANVLNVVNNDTRAGALLSLALVIEEVGGESSVFDELSLRNADPRFIGTVLTRTPTSRAAALQNLLWLEVGTAIAQAPLLLFNALFSLGASGSDADGRTARSALQGGTDGGEPVVGAVTDAGSYSAAFEQLRGLEDVSIVAAPGSSSYGEGAAIRLSIIAHAEQPRAYRIAVLDTPANLLPGEVRDLRSRLDSTRAALYYPWVVTANPLARPGREDIPKEIAQPPSGFICGIYARNDVEHSVAKAPANEVIRAALRFEFDVNFAHNQLLNPLGVNCLRFFPGRGYRVWGARTISSDPEFKYKNVRRYFNYLEASIDRGTQWAVFENNGPRLWNNVRETVESFLYNEWVSGNLLGDSFKEAAFVRCDRTTMTQNDLDNGRLICLVGVAVLKPAEFVIFRLGQKTADARS